MRGSQKIATAVSPLYRTTRPRRWEARNEEGGEVLLEGGIKYVSQPINSRPLTTRRLGKGGEDAVGPLGLGLLLPTAARAWRRGEWPDVHPPTPSLMPSSGKKTPGPCRHGSQFLRPGEHLRHLGILLAWQDQAAAATAMHATPLKFISSSSSRLFLSTCSTAWRGNGLTPCNGLTREPDTPGCGCPSD